MTVNIIGRTHCWVEGWIDVGRHKAMPMDAALLKMVE
jgi:hypothetical protein